MVEARGTQSGIALSVKRVSNGLSRQQRVGRCDGGEEAEREGRGCVDAGGARGRQQGRLGDRRL